MVTGQGEFGVVGLKSMNLSWNFRKRRTRKEKEGGGEGEEELDIKSINMSDHIKRININIISNI